MNTKHLLIAFLPALFFACASSTMGPGAGAAESTVRGNVETVNQHAQNAFHEMNIRQTGTTTDENGRTLKGKMGGEDVEVTMSPTSSTTTKVKVDVSKNLISGKQDVAQDILNKIVQAS
jgi:hypothetical protein